MELLNHSSQWKGCKYMSADIVLQDLNTVKYIAGGGVTLYVIKQLFVLVGKLIPSKETNTEKKSKETSRSKIQSTHTTVQAISECLDKREPAFFEMKSDVHEVHAIIQAKDSDGVPIVYHNGMKRSIDKLAHNIEHQARAIETLSDVLRRS